MKLPIRNPFNRSSRGCSPQQQQTNNSIESSGSTNVVTTATSSGNRRLRNLDKQRQSKLNSDIVVVYKKMDIKDLIDDLKEFLETNSRWSKVFYSCLLYSDLYVTIPTKFPPASSNAIVSLPTVSIFRHQPNSSLAASSVVVEANDEFRDNNNNKKTEEDKCCSICLQGLMEGFGLTRMPCGHVFHVTCIVPWLYKSCICPECRYEIPTNDFLYEIGRQQRMRERTIVKCNCHNGQRHKCFFISDQVVTPTPSTVSGPAVAEISAKSSLSTTTGMDGQKMTASTVSVAVCFETVPVNNLHCVGPRAA